MEGGEVMSGVRGEVSKRNPYYLEKHRYYELKHFCMQYPLWKKHYIEIDGLSHRPWASDAPGSDISDPTGKCAEIRERFVKKMGLVEQAAISADPELFQYLVKGVTEGCSYESLRLRFGIPCCKDVYYSTYRKFFWLLDKIRD